MGLHAIVRGPPRHLRVGVLTNDVSAWALHGLAAGAFGPLSGAGGGGQGGDRRVAYQFFVWKDFGDKEEGVWTGPGGGGLGGEGVGRGVMGGVDKELSNVHVFAAGTRQKLSNVLCIVSLYSKYSRALIFQNFFVLFGPVPALPPAH